MMWPLISQFTSVVASSHAFQLRRAPPCCTTGLTLALYDGSTNCYLQGIQPISDG
jgi:hypothetical protein